MCIRDRLPNQYPTDFPTIPAIEIKVIQKGTFNALLSNGERELAIINPVTKSNESPGKKLSLIHI